MSIKNKGKDDSVAVPLFSVKQRGLGVLSVSARDLHAALKLRGRPSYEEWINSKIVAHRLLDGRDYVSSRIRIGQGCWLNDYFLMLSTAQALCMSEGYWAGGAVRKSLVETEMKISRKHQLHQQSQSKRDDVHLLMDQRALYWSHVKLEMLLATGMTYAHGELHANVLKSADALLEEITKDLKTELSSGKISQNDRRLYVENWKPAFALVIAAELHE